MQITKAVTFDAAHFLVVDADEASVRPYDRMHGHSFLLEVSIKGEPNADPGWVVDFGELTDAMDALKEQLDHRLLNEIEGLEKPTLENICQWVALKLRDQFSGLTQVKVGRPSNGESCCLEIYQSL